LRYRSIEDYRDKLQKSTGEEREDLISADTDHAKFDVDAPGKKVVCAVSDSENI
jgi:hypothetical protein